MSTDMQRLIGTSDEDDEEDMGMDVKDGRGNDGKRLASSSMLAAMDGSDSSNNCSQFRHHPQAQEQPSTPGGTRRPRPVEEKERTKLRERHRRAITARILAGLRRHGNYNLRVRADINDVIAALAREAGWVVLPDGTTFPSKSQGTKPPTDASIPVAASSSNAVHQQTPPSPLTAISSGYQHETEYDACQLKGVFDTTSSLYDVPPITQSHSSSLVGDRADGMDGHLLVGGIDSIVHKQVVEPSMKLQERDFAGTPYAPVYVMLPLGVLNMKCELIDPDGLFNQLRMLKSINVDGVRVDCWWGIVEAQSPQAYNWNGYRRLFQIVRELRLKLQVVMSFHECGGNFSDDVCIPLPHWVTEIGRSNPSIYFTDKEGRRNPDCLSWGIDKERVLQGRTAVEVYFDYMRSFRIEFNEFFQDGIISMIEIGLGPCGELRYPSFPVKHGWRYPGIGAFQCYDQYLMKSLKKAAEVRGHPYWARCPDNAGSYSSQPHETGFFCDGGDYDGYYGRFFLNWYSQVLIEHGDRVLHLAKLAFEGTCISAKLSGIHWWYKTASHAAELTAGYYNPCNRDGYAAIMSLLKKHEIALNFACTEVGILCQQEDFHDSVADRDGLMWQVSNAAWDASILMSSENRLSCHSREGYNELLERAKPMNDPDGRHLLSFAYHRYSPLLTERHNFVEFQRFVKRMHGDAAIGHQVPR